MEMLNGRAHTDRLNMHSASAAKRTGERRRRVKGVDGLGEGENGSAAHEETGGRAAGGPAGRVREANCAVLDAALLSDWRISWACALSGRTLQATELRLALGRDATARTAQRQSEVSESVNYVA